MSLGFLVVFEHLEVEISQVVAVFGLELAVLIFVDILVNLFEDLKGFF